ncbi:hypothetical protein SORBI_3006G089266 [Sorghum bicolor]|uniref:Uncharacterized protein n=1 Tax=Sorghum bicolor TaxID=4558 RepID=A0A1Z5RE24_SORBI|nr:hypothetical protein SORBI_3006G089266 [Sorghum bicolor]
MQICVPAKPAGGLARYGTSASPVDIPADRWSRVQSPQISGRWMDNLVGSVAEPGFKSWVFLVSERQPPPGCSRHFVAVTIKRRWLHTAAPRSKETALARCRSPPSGVLIAGDCALIDVHNHNQGCVRDEGLGRDGERDPLREQGTVEDGVPWRNWVQWGNRKGELSGEWQ